MLFFTVWKCRLWPAKSDVSIIKIVRSILGLRWNGDHHSISNSTKGNRVMEKLVKKWKNNWPIVLSWPELWLYCCPESASFYWDRILFFLLFVFFFFLAFFKETAGICDQINLVRYISSTTGSSRRIVGSIHKLEKKAFLMQKNGYSLIGLRYKASNAKIWVIFVLRTLPLSSVDQARLLAFESSHVDF